MEYILLAVCLCVIALRATYTEGLPAQSATQTAGLTDTIYSLSASALLILSVLVWFVWSLFSKKFSYRFTGLEIGIALFAAAAVIAYLAAADKRTAVTHAVSFLAPALAAALLVQILDSNTKIKLLLAVVAALAIASTNESLSQLLTTNQALIDRYEQQPESLLQPLNIEQGTLQQFLFEHRLYTRGVRGFFTTGNSVGSFSLLAAFAALALFLDKLRNRKHPPSLLPLITSAIAVAAILFGLLITKSKGAIAAAIAAAAVFIIFLRFGDWLKKYKTTLLIACLLLTVTAASGVVTYGLTHDRLPGGNSMLVRWQYWAASAKMYADHPLTGVGGGNFADFYTRYKPPAALESVADPHNFLLSFLTQYGPLGLLAFLTLIALPLYRIISPAPASLPPITDRSQPSLKKLTITFAVIISLTLLILRPMLLKTPPVGPLEVKIYVAFVLYLMPVIIFILGLWLLTISPTATLDTRTAAIALFCASSGLLLHNLIDYAIFEPGVLTAFWVLLAALIAIDCNQKNRPPLVLKTDAFAKWLTAVAAVTITWAYFNYVYLPPVKAAYAITLANQNAARGRLRQAHNLLSAAAANDTLSPAAPALNARLHLQQFDASPSENKPHFRRAESCFLQAIRLNPADYKNYEKLAQTYIRFAETSEDPERTDYLEKALDTSTSAVHLYPGSARLRFQTAQIAETLNKNDLALQQYQKAVEIEYAFRTQFMIMYPDRKIVSRLGQDKYHSAKQKIEFHLRTTQTLNRNFTP
jgi:O-antigen ligase/tetratricopeptide (TPR) repeat protein